jgi:hypothetical protein
LVFVKLAFVAPARQRRRYVDANYSWPVILDRYTAFLQRFTGSFRANGPSAQGNGLP